jgi:hypothetical protein
MIARKGTRNGLDLDQGGAMAMPELMPTKFSFKTM